MGFVKIRSDKVFKIVFRALALEAPDEWCTMTGKGKPGSLSRNSHSKSRSNPAADRTFQPPAESIWA